MSVYNQGVHHGLIWVNSSRRCSGLLPDDMFWIDETSGSWSVRRTGVCSKLLYSRLLQLLLKVVCVWVGVGVGGCVCVLLFAKWRKQGISKNAKATQKTKKGNDEDRAQGEEEMLARLNTYSRQSYQQFNPMDCTCLLRRKRILSHSTYQKIPEKCFCSTSQFLFQSRKGLV